MSIYEASLTYYLYVKRKRMMLMKLIIVIVMVVTSTIINIVSYIVVKREVGKIKLSFKQIRNVYRKLKEQEN